MGEALADFLIVLLIDNQEQIATAVVSLIGLFFAWVVRKFQVRKGTLAAQAISVAEKMAVRAAKSGKIQQGLEKGEQALAAYKQSKGPVGRLVDRARPDGGRAAGEKAIGKQFAKRAKVEAKTPVAGLWDNEHDVGG